LSAFPILYRDQVAAALDQSGLVLLDFWQESCAPCRALEPRLEALAQRRGEEFAGYRVDVDTDPDIPAEFDVRSIPTLVLLRDGREVTRLDGLIRDNDLDQALDDSETSDAQ
jgi:thioredoxin 1